MDNGLDAFSFQAVFFSAGFLGGTCIARLDDEQLLLLAMQDRRALVPAPESSLDLAERGVPPA
jgi:hypothetical protein